MIKMERYIELLNRTDNHFDGDIGIKNLMKYLQDNKPQSLFHYRRCSDMSIKAFKDNNIYFNTAKNFNDPYDCLVYCDNEKISDMIMAMCNKGNFENIYKNIEEENFIDSRPKFISRELAKQLIDYFKDEKIKEILKNIPVEIIDKIQIDLQNITNTIIADYTKYYQTEMPLVCLSEQCDDILMWSHYSDNHKGFVIEYDIDSLNTSCSNCPKNKTFRDCANWKQVMLLPIYYTDKRYDATRYIFDNILIRIFKMYGYENIWQTSDKFAQYKINIYKHESWSYEKEWRLQLYRTNGAMFINVKPKAIYLGCRISEVYEDILVKYAQEQNIEIYKMSENNSKQKYVLRKQKYKQKINK